MALNQAERIELPKNVTDRRHVFLRSRNKCLRDWTYSKGGGGVFLEEEVI